MSKPTKNRFLIFLKDPNKKSIFKMFKESLHLWILRKEIPYYYFKYLYRKNVPNYLDYVSTKEANRIKFSDKYHFPELLSIISNKLSFSIYCTAKHLPVPELLSHNFNSNFILNGNSKTIKNKEGLEGFFQDVMKVKNTSTIFIKPLSLYGGTGCYKLSKTTFKEDIEKCADFILRNACVHEAFVLQHKDINTMHAGCINTIRMETFIDDSGKIHILSAFMRFGVGDSFVDNAHSGGFYVGINLESGSLNKLGHQYMEYGGGTFTHHPDSGIKLEGFKIPYFKETCKLVHRATTIIPDRYIGWDIAISNNGPIIIEANEYPSIFMADIAYGGYRRHPLYEDIISGAL